MINLGSIINENSKRHNKKYPYIPDHPYRILIIGGPGSGKTNALINLIREQDKGDVIDKMYLYARNLNKPKYQFLIEECENVGIKHYDNPNAFIECSNTKDHVYEKIGDYNLSRKRERKKLIAFDDMIPDIMTNRRFQALINKLFIRCNKSRSLLFLLQKMSD